MCSGLVAAQAARKLAAPMVVVGEFEVAFGRDFQLRQACDWQADSCSGGCGDRLGDYVDGVEAGLEVESCDDRVTALCQGWA